MKLKPSFTKTLYKKITSHKSKRRFILFAKIFAIFALLGIGLSGAVYSAFNLKYNFNESIEYNGGYEATVQVYDYNKSSIGGKHAFGSNRVFLPYLQKKLNPLGDQYYHYQYLGADQISVSTSKNNFKFHNQQDFIQIINRNGGLSLMTNDPDHNKGGTKYGQDLLVSYDQKKKTYSRIKISSVVTDPLATVDRMKKPVLKFTTGSNFKTNVADKMTKLITADKDTKLYIWKNIGMVFDYLRNHFSDYYNYKKIITAFHEWETYIPTEKRNSANQLFQYEKRDATGRVVRSGSFFENLPGPVELKDLVSQGFQWSVPQRDLQTNPIDDTIAPSVVAHIIPWEPVLQQIYQNQIVPRSKLNSFLLNHYQITHGTTQDFQHYSAGFFLPMDSESSATTAQNLILGNFKGAAFQTLSSNVLRPVVSKTLLRTTFTVFGILMFVFGLYLVVQFRLFGLIVFYNFIVALITTIYVSSLLFVNFSPIAIAGLLIVFTVLMSGVILIMTRYKNEKLTTSPPDLVCYKIALRKRLPYFLDGLVVFFILALSFFAFSSGAVESFSITLLISLLVGTTAIVFCSLVIFYLFVKTRLFIVAPFLDMQKSFSFKLFRFTFAPAYRSASGQEKAGVSKVDVEEILEKSKKSVVTIDDNDHGAGAPLPLTMGTTHHNDLLTTSQEMKKPKQPPHVKIPSSHSGKKRLGGKLFARLKGWGAYLAAHVSFYRLFKWSPLVLVVFVVGATALLLTHHANLDQTLVKGTSFSYYDIAWKHHDSQKYTWQEQKDYIATAGSNGAVGWNHQWVNPFAGWSTLSLTFAEGPGNDEGASESLVISTNLTDLGQVQQFNNWLFSTMSEGVRTLGIYVLDHLPTYPTATVATLKYVFISIAIGSAIILVYVIFRYDWGQMIVILVASVFSMLLATSFIVLVHVPLTINVIVLLSGLWCFAVVNTCFVMSRVSENKKKYDITAYQEFFVLTHNYFEVKKDLQAKINFARRSSMKWTAKKMCRQNPALKPNNAYQAAYHLMLVKKYQYKAQLDDHQKLLKIHRQTFKKYNFKNNFLYKAATTTFQSMLFHVSVLTMLMALFSVAFVIFGMSLAGFFIAVLICVIAVLYSSLIIALPLWVRIEEFRSLRYVRFRKYLQQYKTDVDEEEIEGINVASAKTTTH